MTNKIALLAAAASLTFAGAAFAQEMTAPAAPQATPPAATTPDPTAPASPTAPAQSMTPAPTTESAAPAAATQPSATPAESAATPSSATAADIKVGAAVKDAQGVSVGQITGTSTGADGSTNVIVTNGGVKFALPGNSLSAAADGSVSTTATKAQIDATVAGAKPQ
ncbi:hypothetical protein [Caulobacter sp. RHG1]|uniref:hypothetical protein n=1 Tax=Caulobacter sp. (strain RHG1) TaxID=2545762 RepID=UPI0015582C2E|nr:hypothetical protein [Caulobacter sp. RHG1]NQE60957.1 hypothetical protein [Caulobacter sp. RHG1]